MESETTSDVQNMMKQKAISAFSSLEEEMSDFG
jgi:hypothetical protein